MRAQEEENAVFVSRALARPAVVDLLRDVTGVTPHQASFEQVERTVLILNRIEAEERKRTEEQAAAREAAKRSGYCPW